MQTIVSILNDFYICSKLPIRAIDMNLKEIYTVGYNDEIDHLFNISNVISKISDTDNNLDRNYISYKDINYLIVPIFKYNNNKGYYILGPYKFEERPMSVINYIYSLLLEIHNDKFSKGRINFNFTPFIRKAVEYCIKNYDSAISIDDICSNLNINKSYFCKKFKEETGYTFCNFLNTFRIEKSKDLLKNTDMSLLDVAVSVGFNSQNYYTMVFKKLTNQTPIQFRKNN